MSLAHDHVTWQTGYLGDIVKVYATAEPDGEGAVAIWWHWKRKHSSGRILARSVEPKKRRKDALWEANRVNPPVTETARRISESPQTLRKRAEVLRGSALSLLRLPDLDDEARKAAAACLELADELSAAAQATP